MNEHIEAAAKAIAKVMYPDSSWEYLLEATHLKFERMARAAAPHLAAQPGEVLRKAAQDVLKLWSMDVPLEEPMRQLQDVLREYTCGPVLKAALAQPPQNGAEPPSESGDCVFCSGEACATHGVEACDCDSTDRHAILHTIPAQPAAQERGVGALFNLDHAIEAKLR